jgi:hypothetical protein
MDFLAFVRSLAKRDAPPTSAELRKALAEAEAAAAEGQTRCAQLAAERANVLLDATDAALDRVERALQLAQRDADRADLAAATLRERIAEAEAAERQAELDRTYEAGVAAADEYQRLVTTTYRKLAGQMVEVARRLSELEATRTAANMKLSAANYGRGIPDPDKAVRPRGPELATLDRIEDVLRLPASEGRLDMLAWPAGMMTAGYRLDAIPQAEWPVR